MASRMAQSLALRLMAVEHVKGWVVQLTVEEARAVVQALTRAGEVAEALDTWPAMEETPVEVEYFLHQQADRLTEPTASTEPTNG